MSFVGDLIGDVFGGITGASQAADAADKASGIQYEATKLGIDEQKRQFDALVKLMSPYVTQGTQALSAQGDIAGLGGANAQQQAIAGIENSPIFQSLRQQGENSILQNASATGGLRGGNVQGALGQFSPALLQQLIEQQYGRLGGIASLGQNAAAGQGNAGVQTGSSIADLLQQGGAARAGGVLAAGSVPNQTFGQLTNLAGSYFGAKGF